eukprot:4912083-Pleurochrysis_carterae.AAC.2
MEAQVRSRVDRTPALAGGLSRRPSGAGCAPAAPPPTRAAAAPCPASRCLSPACENGPRKNALLSLRVSTGGSSMRMRLYAGARFPSGAPGATSRCASRERSSRTAAT